MLAKRRIGILGGSFNPAHAGHVHISREAIKRLGLDEVWWLVSPHNPLKKKHDLADYGTRFSMAQKLSASHRRICVLDVEQREGLSYSIDTVRYLQRRYPRTQFVWLMGTDNLQHFHRWRNWRGIAAHVAIAVLDRAPYALQALHAPFARHYARRRCLNATQLLAQPVPAWMFVTIPRHPQSASHLRKTLGTAAFMVHN